MLSHAKRYLSLGLSVIPLRTRGKEPLIDWKKYQTTLPTIAELTQWWTKWPDANLGIITGMISAVVVVDLDGPEGIASGQRLGLKSSVVSLTGDGKHLFFKYSEGICNSASQLAEKVDVRGEGGYVVMPPSIHPNGRRYRFLNPLNALEQLPDFPVGLLRAPAENSNTVKSESWISEALEEIKNGHTHNTLVRVLGKFRAHNFSERDAQALLLPAVLAGGMETEALTSKISEIWSRYEPKRIDSAYVHYEPNTERNRSIIQSNYRQQNFGDRSSDQGLVIHSPTNPDSIEQFEQHRLGLDTETSVSLKTGYPKLDQMLKGGLKSSRLFTIAARTGVGKTNWLLGVCRTLCEEGKKVLLFSTEMPYAQIWERYIQTLANPEQFREHQFYVCDSFAPNLERVEEAINEIRPDVFMFDHINHVSEEQSELGAFMQGLNFLRRKYDIAGIVTAQLNRQADWVDIKTGEKITPRMSMIKGSGTIEQASSRVLLLSETRVTPEGTEIVGNLDKNDNGDKGLIHFILKKGPYRMEEV